MHFLLNGSPYLIQSCYLQPLHEIGIDPEIVPGIGGFWLKILTSAKEIVFSHEPEYTFRTRIGLCPIIAWLDLLIFGFQIQDSLL